MTSVALRRMTDDKERERSRNCGLPEGGWRVAEHALFELAIMECWFLYDYKTFKDNKKNCDNKTAHRMSARSYIIFLLSDKKKI